MNERETTAAIDRTLAGDPVVTGYPLEHELQELTLALAADAPEPDAAFAEQLDERVALGFPRDGHVARLRLARARAAARVRRMRVPLGGRGGRLLGAAASLLVVLAIAVPLAGDDTASEHAGVSAAGGSTTEQLPAGSFAGAAPDGRVRRGSALASEPAVDVVAGDRAARRRLPRRLHGLAGGVPARPGFAPGERDRRIERAATLVLAAPASRLDRVAADVAAVTERHRGFVLRSSLATGDRGATTGGDFELRVPAARLQQALADLAKLGQVRARTQTGDDVTAAFANAGDRLQAARAERRGLLARLEAAGSDNEVDSLRLRLDANAREIDRHQARLRSMRVRTDYASVSVTLEPRAGDGAAGAPGDGLGGALDDSLATLGDSLELAVRALGVALPLGLLVAAAAFAARTFQRRRRDAALS